MQNRPRNLSKMDMESHQKSLQNRPQNCRKFDKIDLWGCLGALWGPSWRQDGARATTRAKTIEKYTILGSAWRFKMEPTSNNNMIKNRLDFCNDFETTLFRS